MFSHHYDDSEDLPSPPTYEEIKNILAEN